MQYSFDYENQAIINEIDAYQLQIYPNPTNNWLTIKSDDTFNCKTEITLVNAAGKVMQTGLFEKGKSSYVLNLSEYINGVYLLQLKSDKINQSRKIIKQ